MEPGVGCRTFREGGVPGYTYRWSSRRWKGWNPAGAALQALLHLEGLSWQALVSEVGLVAALLRLGALGSPQLLASPG